MITVRLSTQQNINSLKPFLIWTQCSFEKTDLNSISKQTCIKSTVSLTKSSATWFHNTHYPNRWCDDAFRHSQLLLKCCNTMFIQWRVILKSHQEEEPVLTQACKSALSPSLLHTHMDTHTFFAHTHLLYAHLCETSYWRSHSLLCDTIIMNLSSKQSEISCSKFIQVQMSQQ